MAKRWWTPNNREAEFKVSFIKANSFSLNGGKKRWEKSTRKMWVYFIVCWKKNTTTNKVTSMRETWCG